MELDTSKWSGEGEFTTLLVERLREVAGVHALRVEDAPASRAESDYNFISNELFVTFATRTLREPIRRFGILPAVRTVTEKLMTVAELEQALTALSGIGAPDYADGGMLQYPAGGADRAAVSDQGIQACRARENLRGRLRAPRAIAVMPGRFGADT